MATMHLDDVLYGRLRSRADASGSTVEADVHEILARHAAPAEKDEQQARRTALCDLIVQVQAAPFALPEENIDTTELIRQMREEEETALLRLVRGRA